MNQGIYFGQIVIGPAGSGKSTYCKHIQEMAQTLHRHIVFINLDPAAQYSEYKCDIDIKQLITLDDVMEQMQLGPNGGLLFCIEYLIQNQQWLKQQLDSVIGTDGFAIFDCPGQIQLFSDQSLFREIVKILQQYGFSLVSMYMMDVNFITDNNKFASGILQALSAQIALELPSITVLTKCDLISNPDTLQKYLNYFEQNEQLVQDLQNEQYGWDTKSLINSIRMILNQNAIVSIRSLNLQDEDSIRELLWQADHAIQYGENLQPDDKIFQQAEEILNQ